MTDPSAASYLNDVVERGVGIFAWKMLRRKPTKIEAKVEDKEELEEARRNASAATTASAGTASLLRQLDRGSEDPSSKAHRIGLSS
ncbi:hypothetical protein VNO78_23406 [Psophocarpus tetragonolobus]|uniref:Uncharacterized protein n=1 Tax=Psophocarpus tetragonolobus TaxID=3891 RepID=A0AAN9S372_PSOTE